MINISILNKKKIIKNKKKLDSKSGETYEQEKFL